MLRPSEVYSRNARLDQLLKINQDNIPCQRTKEENHIVISNDAEKSSDKIQHSFMIKILIKVGIEGVYLNITKTIYDKPITNITLNDEKLKALHLNSGIGQGCSLLPLLFSKVLRVLTTVLK